MTRNKKNQLIEKDLVEMTKETKPLKQVLLI